MIPVLSYLQVRNSCSWLRVRSSSFLGFFGQHSLEVYLLQHHIWLKKNAKAVLVLFADPRVNMVAATAQMMILATIVFLATAALNRLLFQHGPPGGASHPPAEGKGLPVTTKEVSDSGKPQLQSEKSGAAGLPPASPARSNSQKHVAVMTD